MIMSHNYPTMSTTPYSKLKRHWSAADKAKLVRRHLRDGIPVATLAGENDTSRNMIRATKLSKHHNHSSNLLRDRQMIGTHRNSAGLGEGAQSVKEYRPIQTLCSDIF
jgi:transposase-like protein